MPEEFRRRVPGLFVFGAFLALFLACYSSTLTARYGYVDDYPLLWMGVSEWDFHMMVASGRPLYALWIEIIFSSASDIEELRWLRLIGVIGLSWLACSMFLMLTRSGASGFHAFCVSVAIGCSLPFQVITAIANAPFAFSAAISGLAFRLGDRAFHSRRPRAKWLSAAGSCLALLAALLIYQPAAMFFWVFAFVGLLGSEAPLRETVRRFAWCCMIGLAGMMLGFATYKLGASSYPEINARGELVRDVAARVEWFLCDGFPGVVNAVALSPARWLLDEASAVAWQADARLFVGVFVIVLGGLALHFRGALREKFWKFLIAACLLILSHAHGLIVEEDAQAYRVFGAITSVVVVCVYFALLGYGRSLSRLSPFHANVVAGGAAFFCALSAAHHVRDCFVAPQVRELEFMRSQLAQGELSRAETIHVIPPDPAASPFASTVHWEFGWPSSAYYWTPADMVGLLLGGLSAEHAHLPVVVAASGVSAGDDSLIVDMRGFRESGEWLRSDDPRVFGMPMIRSGFDVSAGMTGREGVFDRKEIRPGFDVYLDEDELLHYVKEPCLDEDRETPIFLHVTPVDPDDLPERDRAYGYHNMDFFFDASGVKVGDRCIATVRLPRYAVSLVETGQSASNASRTWRGAFSLSDERARVADSGGGPR